MSKLNDALERLVQRVSHCITDQLRNLGLNFLVNLVADFLPRVVGDFEVRGFNVEVVSVDILGFFVVNVVIKWLLEACVDNLSVPAFRVLVREETLLAVIVISVAVQLTTLVKVPLEVSVD
jgi:hypothetical protein